MLPCLKSLKAGSLLQTRRGSECPMPRLTRALEGDYLVCLTVATWRPGEITATAQQAHDHLLPGEVMQLRKAYLILILLELAAVPVVRAQGHSGLGQSFVAPSTSPFLESIDTGDLRGGVVAPDYIFLLV